MFRVTGYNYLLLYVYSITDLLICGCRDGGGVMMMAIVIVTGPIPTRGGGGMKQMRKRLEIRGDRIDMKFPRRTRGHFDDIIEC